MPLQKHGKIDVGALSVQLAHLVGRQGLDGAVFLPDGAIIGLTDEISVGVGIDDGCSASQ